MEKVIPNWMKIDLKYTSIESEHREPSKNSEEYHNKRKPKDYYCLIADEKIVPNFELEVVIAYCVYESEFLDMFVCGTAVRGFHKKKVGSDKVIGSEICYFAVPTSINPYEVDESGMINGLHPALLPIQIESLEDGVWIKVVSAKIRTSSMHIAFAREYVVAMFQ